MNIQHNFQATCKHLNVCPFSGCSISINNDLPEPQPLLLIPGGSKDVHGFYLPKDADGNVTLAAGQIVLLACPGNFNGFSNTNIGLRTALATCDSGTTFSIDSVSYNFWDFNCTFNPVHTARYSNSTCYDGTKRAIEVGFEVGTHFYKLIDICFDDGLYTTLYVKATIVSGIAGSEKGKEFENYIGKDFFPEIPLEKLYDTKEQQKIIHNLLNLTQPGNQYINTTHFLSRGHHSAKADYVYSSQQRATYNYVNISPQWQPFNGANWGQIESSVRKYAENNTLDLVVYTGTHGVATLPNVHGIETELYLYEDSNNKKSIPVPKLFWKAVYDPKSQAGVVFVGINNPYVSDPKGDYLICIDVCSKMSWVNWDQKNITRGYSYCCEVDDFRSTVKTLPQFSVSGLLTDGGNTDDRYFLGVGYYVFLIKGVAYILKLF